MTSFLVTGARAPVALHWARLLHAAGHRVVLADSQRFPIASATRCKADYVRLPSPRGRLGDYACAVEEVVRRERCDLVIPTCEEVFFLAAARDLLDARIELFAPSFEQLAHVHDKYSFSIMAAEYGMAPTETLLLENREEVAGLIERAGEFVFKPVWSRFGERTLVRPTAAALQRLEPTAADPWVAQSFLPGEEFCTWAMAIDGRLQALQSYRPLYRAGLGAAVAIEPAQDEAIPDFVARFVAGTGWSGQVSFDFRRDEDGMMRAIECNPRATSGLHFFTSGDGLPDALAGNAVATASSSARYTLPLAMFFYGLPYALRHAGLRQWAEDTRDMHDLMQWPGDRDMRVPQLVALAEIALLALRGSKSLKAASTDDIEWNGEELA